jgi:hypothetical protein
MTDTEQIEKLRQGIMRFRELLDLLHAELNTGEQAYVQLFAHCTPEEKAALKEKDLQRRAALALIDDSSALRDAALHLRFVTRHLERDFEQLHDNLIPAEADDA